jgi:hypothetical protein
MPFWRSKNNLPTLQSALLQARHERKDESRDEILRTKDAHLSPHRSYQAFIGDIKHPYDFNFSIYIPYPPHPMQTIEFHDIWDGSKRLIL